MKTNEWGLVSNLLPTLQSSEIIKQSCRMIHNLCILPCYLVPGTSLGKRGSESGGLDKGATHLATSHVNKPCLSWRSHSHWHRTWDSSKHAGELRVRKLHKIHSLTIRFRPTVTAVDPPYETRPQPQTPETETQQESRQEKKQSPSTIWKIYKNKKNLLDCFPSKQFCYKRVLEWACILTRRQKENKKWILDTPLEIDTDRGPQTW